MQSDQSVESIDIDIDKLFMLVATKTKTRAERYISYIRILKSLDPPISTARSLSNASDQKLKALGIPDPLLKQLRLTIIELEGGSSRNNSNERAYEKITPPNKKKETTKVVEQESAISKLGQAIVKKYTMVLETHAELEDSSKEAIKTYFMSGGSIETRNRNEELSSE